MKKTAVLSEDEVYRYLLGRRWSADFIDVWIMLNPSTADAEIDDPTIRRCMRFSDRDGAGGIIVVNLFALRSTNPAALAGQVDPVGEHNDRKIAQAATYAKQRGGRVIAAWGAHPMAKQRAIMVRNLTWPASLLCLGTTKAGAPRHPLYVPNVTEFIPWESR